MSHKKPQLLMPHRGLCTNNLSITSLDGHHKIMILKSYKLDARGLLHFSEGLILFGHHQGFNVERLGAFPSEKPS